MTLSQLFEQLGAPLANVRWSWGAVRESDSAVFLRVWQDECRPIDGRMCVRIRSRATPREIAGFDRDDIFIGGKPLEVESHVWLEMADRRPVAAIRAQQ
jgi:hypothetical protein